MDKKPNYSRQVLNKAIISEPRKSSDLFPNKPASRNGGKRRENSNSSNFKNDNNQRNYNNINKLRNVDKRPKARSYGGASTIAAIPFDISTTSSGLELEKLAINDGYYDDIDAELNTIHESGNKKKQNLNHLLNFNYNSRENGGSGLNIFGRSSGNRIYTKKPKYNKEQFLQANFQFVIKSDEEPRIDVSSPDTLVDWSIIEQINIQTTEEPQCPICLYPPISAKLTRCGHVYCWPCLLHYLALSDKTWRKCPICYEAIHVNDLKTTSIIQQTNFKVGDYVTLQLMRRKKGSMFVEKMNTKNETTIDQLPHLSDPIEKRRFSKFLLADYNEVLVILEKERKELIVDEDMNCPESVFIQQALDLLKERKIIIAKALNVNYEELEKLTDLALLKEIEFAKNDYSVDPEFEKTEATNVLNENLTGAIQKDDKYYYFYQSVDGQNIYLHPLNVKMLQNMYGSLDKGPDIITSKILQQENLSMNENHRKKFTCLGHLPLTCQFETVEVNLKPPIVSEDILKMFKDDIMQREKVRQRRDKEEKKREKQINEINDRQMGKFINQSANIDMQSSQQFPVWDYEYGNSFGALSSSLSHTSDLAHSPPIQLKNFESFANVLSSPKKEFWPILENTNTNAKNQVNCTWANALSSKTVKNQPALKGNETKNSDGNEIKLEDNFMTTNNFSDVLAEAFEKNKKIKNDAGCVSAGSNKKSKKNKKTLLFSSGMNFGSN